MPLFYQKRIRRIHLRANPQVLFVFGDNVDRIGDRGQAAEMRGEPNAVGVATKWFPATSHDAYFYDRQEDLILRIWAQDLDPVHAALCQNRIVVWPQDGIGTGLSQLPQRAPELWTILEETRQSFETI